MLRGVESIYCGTILSYRSNDILLLEHASEYKNIFE